MSTSILASTGRMLWRYLDACKIDADALFTRCGLDPSLIQDSRSRISYQLLCKTYVEASVITMDENIGLHFAKHCSPLDLNALGMTFLSSGTLKEAFQRLLRYEAVVNSNLLLSIIETEGRVDLISTVPDVPADAVQIVEDSRTAVLVDLCRLGLDTSLDPVEVTFTYPEPKNTGDHFGLFRCPVKFSQPASRISFHSEDTERPFTAANRELAFSGDQILEGMINDLKNADIVSQVKRAIIDSLSSGTPKQDQIAKQISVSSRTLQRRLAEENTNLRTLVLDVRRELATSYIADRTMPLGEISYMLGFADTSSFSRAFKKWTGDSPATFRHSLQA